MLCYYWYFEDLEFKFEPNVCNKYYDVSMAPYELKNNSILNVKIVDYRCVLRGNSRHKVVNILNNAVLEDKGTL